MEIYFNKHDYSENKKIILNKFSTKEKYYYSDIHQYFKNVSTEDIEKMIQIIDTKSKISLRILDWFITKYSNENKTSYHIDSNINDIGFTVHIGYKSQLKTYKKRYFDPFRRYKKFFYYYKVGDKYKRFETTIGQLNFFKWSFQKKVIEFVENNFSELIKAMNLSNKEDKERKKNKKLQKQITESSTTPLSSESSYTETNSEEFNIEKTDKNKSMEILLRFD